MRRILGITAVVLCGGCGLSPISNRLDLGKDPFVVFVGEGIDRSTDLFVAQSGGGRVLQLTFSPVIEANPRVVPDGSVVAFLRMRDTLPGTHRDIVLMSLANGSEYQLALPAEAGMPGSIAWSDDAKWIYAGTPAGVWRLTVPPDEPKAEQLTGADRLPADSALARWAGIPRFAPLIACPTGGVCLIGPKGDTVVVTTAGHDGFAWGHDSLAWFERDEMIVRSLGAGTPRRIGWQSPPANPRDATYAGQ